MPDEQIDLHQSTDAKVWADEFMRLWGHRLDQVDHGLMIGWFANAMMAIHDAHRPLPGVITLSAEEVGKIREALTSAAEDEEFRAQAAHLEQAIRRHAAAALRYRDALSILTRAQKEG